MGLVHKAYVADGVDHITTPVVFSALSGVSTLIGATVSASLTSRSSGQVYPANSCTVLSFNAIGSTWSPGTIPAGRYVLRVLATPVGKTVKTVVDEEVDVFP